MKEQVGTVARSLRQCTPDKILSEIRLRSAAGQHQLAYMLLKNFAQLFPSDQVAGEILQEVRTELDSYDAQVASRQELLKLFDQHLAALPDEALKERLKPFRAELAAEMNLNTLDRLAPYRQLADDTTMTPADKLGLAVSGWLMGSNGATNKLGVAISLIKLRDVVRAYLVEPAANRRQLLLDELHSLEGASPENRPAVGQYETTGSITRAGGWLAWLVRIASARPERRADDHLFCRCPRSMTLSGAYPGGFAARRRDLAADADRLVGRRV